MTFSYYYKDVSKKFMFNASLFFTILNKRNHKRKKVKNKKNCF